MRQQDLPPDLRAALSLVLSQRKSYAALAAMLSIEERAVHDRAHAALALLAPRQARELTPAEREQVGEYLLGQADPTQQAAARAHLQRSTPARTWAQALAAELAPLATGPLPEIPAGSPAEPASKPAPAAPEPESRSVPVEPEPVPVEPEPVPVEPEPVPGALEPESKSMSAPSSRRGGAIVLGGIAAVVIVAVALIVGLGGGSHTSSGTTPTAPSAQTSSTSSTATSTTSTTTPTTASGKSSKPSGEPHLDATLTLTSPDPSSKALGIIEVVSEGNQRAFLIAAEHLPPSKGFHYAAWLYNSPTNAFFLGAGPTVDSNGLLKAAGGLPSNAANYNTIVLTEEHSAQPKQPGPIVLHGAFKLS